MKLAPGVTTVTPDDIAKASSPSTQMLLAMGATGRKVYEGTVPAAVVAKRRAKNSGALKAKRLTKDETKKGGKELYTLASLESWLEGLADA